MSLVSSVIGVQTVVRSHQQHIYVYIFVTCDAQPHQHEFHSLSELLAASALTGAHPLLLLTLFSDPIKWILITFIRFRMDGRLTAFVHIG